MKLQQLRYIVEVANNKLNVSLTAEKLFTSQPGISKQIKLLEDELGVQIFIRTGKHLSDITPIGIEIIRTARVILNKTQEIKVMAKEVTEPNQGSLAITTSYTQARYALPLVIHKFINQYPNVALHIEQDTCQQSIARIKAGLSDFAIISDVSELTSDMIALPCYHWNHVVIVMKDHPLTQNRLLSIEQLASYPLVSYDFSNDGSDLSQIFIQANQTPNIVLNTSDADLIKTYVRLGVGVGVVAKMAIHTENDPDFTIINAGHLFPYHTTYVVFLRALFLRAYMYDFINQFSNHLSRKTVDKLLLCETNSDVLTMFNGIKLPVY